MADISASVSRTTNNNQTLTTNVRTKVTFNNTQYDTVTIPSDGKYLIGASIVFDKVTEGYREWWAKLTPLAGGGPYDILHPVRAAQNALPPDPITIECARIDDFKAGDIIELEAKQITGGNLDILTTNNASLGGDYSVISPRFYIQKIA